MPSYCGTLRILVKSTDYGDATGRSYEEDFELDAPAEIFDLDHQREVGDRGNAHNLPVDPVSIAIAAAMGLNWTEIVNNCSSGDDGISIAFINQEGGPNSIVLPTSHPSLDKTKGKNEHIIRCGNQSISILIDQDMYWQCYRDWPSEGGNYTDKGTFDVPVERIPESVLTAFHHRMTEGTLLLGDIIAWESNAMPEAKVREITSSDFHISFQFEFPAGQNGRSGLT